MMIKFMYYWNIIKFNLLEWDKIKPLIKKMWGLHVFSQCIMLMMIKEYTCGLILD